jgi:membrane-associated phospholipid phosphatase
MDRRLSSALYEACHARALISTLVSVLCRVLEWSGDGRLWFALWAVLAAPPSLLQLSPLLLQHAEWVVETRDAIAFAEVGAAEAARLLLRLLLVDLALVGGLKWAVKRRRPSYGRAPVGYVVEVDRYSFPSGHASRAMAIAVGLFGWSGWSARIGWVAWVAWALLVGASRVAYGRHWVGDVAAGWAVGLAVSSIVIIINRSDAV